MHTSVRLLWRPLILTMLSKHLRCAANNSEQRTQAALAWSSTYTEGRGERASSQMQEVRKELGREKAGGTGISFHRAAQEGADI